jgi:hypothetical protein
MILKKKISLKNKGSNLLENLKNEVSDVENEFATFTRTNEITTLRTALIANMDYLNRLRQNLCNDLDFMIAINDLCITMNDRIEKIEFDILTQKHYSQRQKLNNL